MSEVLKIDEKIFKAYDVRATYPDQINEAIAKRIAGAYAAFLQLAGKQVAVGRDVRLSSPSMQAAVIEGLTDAGVNVIDIGLVPSELLYFAVGSLELDGGIQVTASHNPPEWNGLYLVKKGVDMCSGDNGLPEIKALAIGSQEFKSETKGRVESKNLEVGYLDFLISQVDLKSLPKLKMVANNNFGLSGPLAKTLIEKIKAPIEWVELNWQPNGSFPKGQPNPLLESNRAETSQLVRQSSADLAVSWDADGDRCYICDEHGEFIEGCHLTAILAQHLLKKFPGQKVIYDPRNVWAVEETVKAAGGVPVLNKAGHTFIKNRMKQEGALFAGEMSGHFYYRDFFNADNGLLTFLTFLEILAESGQTVSQIAAPFREKYFVSGEINFKVADAAAATKDVEERFKDGQIDRTDGLSIAFDQWRFNLRSSNTEPLLRLNVEARSAATCMNKTNSLTELINYHTTS